MKPVNRLIASLLLVFVAACGDDGRDRQGRETVRFWAMGYEGEVVAALIPEFERENPGIRIELQQVPWTSAHEKLLTSFAGETLPDVSAIGNTWIPEFAAIGALSSLDASLKATPLVDPNDFYPGAWDSGVVDGQIYAVPWYTEVRSVYYNAALLKQAGITRPPESWAEWEASMPALKKIKGLSPILLPLNEFEPLLNLAIQSDEPLLRDGGQYGNFRGAGFRKTLAFYHGIFQKGYAPILTNNQIANVWDEFAKSKINYYVSGPWNIAEFRKRLPPNQLAQLRTMPLPGPNGKGASIAGGTSFVIFKSSKNPEAAWKWVEFLSRPNIQARFYSLTGDLPPRRSAWTSPGFNADPLTAAFQDQLERSKSAPKVPEWERIAMEIRYVGEAVAHGKMSEEEAVVELDRRADRILAKRRWMIAQKRGASQMKTTAMKGWMFAGPAVGIIALFFAVPVVAALALSLTDFDIYALADIRNLRFVFLDNYKGLLGNPLFWKSLGNTLYFVVVGVPLSIAASLGAALLLHSKLGRFKGFFRTAFFAPVVTTIVAVAVIWRYLFHTEYGLINYGLSSLGINPIDWLGDPDWAMPTIILFAVWKNFGYNMIIFLAGLQAIPEDHYEAASIDGANGWQKFRHITVPALGPMLLMVSILTMSGYFQLFAEPYVMTQGGPLQSTLSVLYFMYQEGFTWWNLGNASAVAFLLFLLMSGVTSGLLWFARRKGAEE